MTMVRTRAYHDPRGRALPPRQLQKHSKHTQNIRQLQQTCHYQTEIIFLQMKFELYGLITVCFGGNKQKIYWTMNSYRVWDVYEA